jgi:hypothetical protein
MNRNDFLNMIGSRSRVNRSMLGEVYELVDLFPYFQSAHMLLLKGLRDNDDIKFEKQLRSSAIHIADREVLYYLLKTDNLSPAGISIVKSEPEALIESQAESEFPTETQQTVIDSAKNSDLLISGMELGNEQPFEQVNENESPVTGHSVLMPSGSDNSDSEGVVLFIDESNGKPEEDKVFYMDPGFSVPEYSDLLELDTETTDFEKVIDDTGIKEEPEEPKGEDKKVYKKQLQSDLIDKFIITNPRIEPVRDKTAKEVEDLSKPHTEEKEGFITETLARIYINQGYYSKAIDIFEKLSLKFPEKSSYFAAQIEKVKEYIKK